MINLYIDTNAYLTFFHLSSDDLEEVRKLEILAGVTGEIRLHLPEQTYDEFLRNRDNKIADALKKFKEEKLNNIFPQIAKEHAEYAKMREIIRDFEQMKSKLLEKLNQDIFERKLAADKTFQSLFAHSHFYQTTEVLLNTARMRFDLGKPPGKNKSYGDALNWESLMMYVPNGEDLYFISDDKDYFSETNSDLFNAYLKDEWYRRKSSNIYFYKRISAFCKEKFPHINIASEYEKDTLVKDLQSSGSFSHSRHLLTRLSNFETFSSDQLNALVIACINNSQVFWIREDADIKQFLNQIIQPNRSKINEDLLKKYDAVYQNIVH